MRTSILACLAVLLAACGSSPVETPDAASVDADVLDAPQDGATTDDAPRDDAPAPSDGPPPDRAGPPVCPGAPARTACSLDDGSSGLCDGAGECVGCLAPTDCSAPTPRCDDATRRCAAAEVAVIVARRGSTELVAASYAVGAWSAIEPIGTNDINLGVGAAVLRDGSAIGVSLENGLPYVVDNATFDASGWTMQAATPLRVDDVGVPLATADGNAIMAVRLENLMPISIASYDATSSSWSVASGGSTGVANESGRQLTGPPAVALGAGGDALVAFARITSGSTATFRFTARTAGTWSAEAAIPGAAGTSALVLPRIVLAARAGGEQILAIWSEGSTGASLLSATYADGAWSAVIPIATDAVTGGLRPFVVTTLPDDRIALAYVVSEGGAIGGIAITFFDGVAWSAIRRVTGASIALTQFPVAIGRGIEGAALEVAYFQNVTGEIRHVRLIDETSWTWTTPVVVSSDPFDCLALATGP